MTDSNLPEFDESDAEPLPDTLLPLDSWHRAKGARMVSFAGYVMPIQYDGIMAEHIWTREHAGLFDVSHMGQVVLTGDDAAGALETLLPGELQKLGINRMRYSLLMADDGGILDDLMITKLPPQSMFASDEYANPWDTEPKAPGVDGGFYMVVNGACKYDDLAYMRGAMPDAVTINHLEDRALLALQGPEAGDVMAALLPETKALYFMQAGQFALFDMDLWISRSGYTGEDGFEISVDSSDVERLADLLCTDERVRPIGLGARDSLRLEAGLPLYGHDLSPQTGPIGAGLGFAIQKRRREEGGFAGYESVQRDLADGPVTKRVGFTVAGRLPAREGAPIFAGEDMVGTVTSGGFAPTVGAPIAMGWVEAAYAADGTALDIEVRGKRLAATVVPMPLVPHNYYRQPKA